MSHTASSSVPFNLFSKNSHLEQLHLITGVKFSRFQKIERYLPAYKFQKNDPVVEQNRSLHLCTSFNNIIRFRIFSRRIHIESSSYVNLKID